MVDDKRARLYTNIEAPYGHVELTVQGAEGEKVEDLEGTFSAKLIQALEAQQGLADEDNSDEGFE
jgi:hypothetical protein